LKAMFQSRSKDLPKKMWVVVCDEVDSLLGKVQHTTKKLMRGHSRTAFDSLMTWALMPRSRLCLISISNDMNLTDALLAGHHKQVQRVHFTSYKPEELLDITMARLGDGYEALIQKKALEFLAKKVAAQSGDARNMLEYCRRLLTGLAAPDIPYHEAHDAGPPAPEAHATGRKRSRTETPDPAFAAPGKRQKRGDSAPGFALAVTPNNKSPSTAAASPVPSLMPDTPPGGQPCGEQESLSSVTRSLSLGSTGSAAIGISEAAKVASQRQSSQNLQHLPEKQKWMLIAAVQMTNANAKTATIASWMEYHKRLCRLKSLSVPTDEELAGLVDGLVQLGLVAYGKCPPGTPRRLTKIFVRVAQDDLQYAFGQQMVAMDILGTTGAALARSSSI